MAEFLEVIQTANNGYHDRDDYPPYALDPMSDRNRWMDYLWKINKEIDEAAKGKPS